LSGKDRHGISLTADECNLIERANGILKKQFQKCVDEGLRSPDEHLFKSFWIFPLESLSEIPDGLHVTRDDPVNEDQPDASVSGHHTLCAYRDTTKDEHYSRLKNITWAKQFTLKAMLVDGQIECHLMK
jgi:hypothetical protein